ncbi:MAG TPA: glycosyltransferase family 2 protein, partial [Flavisolibacter sp.]|nr:glycosyltransferase family 2 protein [Flavisolibacter sp.]
QSIYTYLPEFDFEVIVSNNGCDLIAKERLLKKYSKLIWIETGYNAGFARANNIGLKSAKGEVYLLLNPDTICLDNSIEICYKRLMQSSYAAVGVQLLNHDHSSQISGSHFVKGGINHLLPLPYWGSFLRWIGYSLKMEPPSVEQASKEEPVDWISGAFLMVKRSITDKAGLLDEDFFLYAEEVEWCSRLRKYGSLCLYGDLHIIHLEGASINKATQTGNSSIGYYNLYDKKGLQLMVSNHLRVRKQYGVLWFLFLLLNYTWGVFVFAIGSFLHRLFTFRNPLGSFKKVGAFAANVLRLWLLSPLIIRNKPHFYKMF